MKQIYTKNYPGYARKTTLVMLTTNNAKSKKIIVDIIGPKKGYK